MKRIKIALVGMLSYTFGVLLGLTLMLTVASLPILVFFLSEVSADNRAPVVTESRSPAVLKVDRIECKSLKCETFECPCNCPDCGCKKK